jgi:hypothetical protein
MIDSADSRAADRRFIERRSLNSRIVLPMRFQLTATQMHNTINMIAAAAAPPAMIAVAIKLNTRVHTRTFAPVLLLGLDAAAEGGKGVCALLGVTVSVSVAGTSTTVGGVRDVIDGAGVTDLVFDVGEAGTGVRLVTAAVLVAGELPHGVLTSAGSTVKLIDGALPVVVQELPKICALRDGGLCSPSHDAGTYARARRRDSTV